MDLDLKALLSSASGGDQAAWNVLVGRYSGLLWSIARGYRLGAADAADAVQVTWLKLVEHLERIDEPDRLPAWLATTVRRECLQLIRRNARHPSAPGSDSRVEVADPAPSLDHGLLRDERDAALWRALAMLGNRCQQLLRVLMASPPPAYAEVAAALDMPIGSIGPARQRCLGQLRRLVEGDALLGSPQTEGDRS